jgi:hypothetical protein
MVPVSAPSAASAAPVPTPVPVSAGGARRRLVRRRRLVTRLRAKAATTPGLLRLLSVALVVSTALLWAASFTTVVVRQDAVDALAGKTGPSFLAAQRIHADLAAADAAAAHAFLTGGVEQPRQRAAFEGSIASATRHVIQLVQAGGPAEVREPLTVLAGNILSYTNLVERARTNNRVGFVVGAAYLRQASALMQNTILPAADALAAVDAGRIDSEYAKATRWYHPVLVAAAGVVCLAGLVAVQLLLYRRNHRVLNVGLVAATLVVALTTGVVLAAFSVERARLVDGRDHGFVPVSVVAQARVLALRAWGDESLSLIARGNGAAFDRDAETAATRLGYDADGRPTGSGVLPAAANLSGPGGQTRAGLDESWRAYHTTNLKVRSLVNGVGGFQDAVKLAVGDGSVAFNRFDRAADAAMTTSQRQFDARLSSAGDGIGYLAGGVTAALALAVVLALAGLQVRINEYR